LARNAAVARAEEVSGGIREGGLESGEDISQSPYPQATLGLMLCQSFLPVAIS
jgi:hypothetical protein